MNLATNLIFFATIDRDTGRLTASPLPHQYNHFAMLLMSASRRFPDGRRHQSRNNGAMRA
jgi:hypothetical protein